MMGRVLEIIGWLIVLGTMALLIMAAGNMPPGNASIQGAAMMIWAGPPIFFGILIIVFGSMLTELVAIRKIGDQQTGLLREIANARYATQSPDAPYAPTPRTDRKAMPVLGKSRLVTCVNCGRENSASDVLCECGLSVRAG